MVYNDPYTPGDIVKKLAVNTVYVMFWSIVLMVTGTAGAVVASFLYNS
jgi:hypothetical protein